MTDTPQLLLAHHLKALKLPTFLREYDKLARQCAAEGVDHMASSHGIKSSDGVPASNNWGSYWLRLATVTSAVIRLTVTRRLRRSGPFVSTLRNCAP